MCMGRNLLPLMTCLQMRNLVRSSMNEEESFKSLLVVICVSLCLKDCFKHYISHLAKMNKLESVFQKKKKK